MPLQIYKYGNSLFFPSSAVDELSVESNGDINQIVYFYSIKII